MNRLLIFAHHNPHQTLSDYVLYWLLKMNPLFERIIFISNSRLKEVDHEKLRKFSVEVIISKNRGFHLGAWKAAIEKEGWSSLEKYDSVTLMNDNFFGPVFDISGIYEFMEENGADAWGISNHKLKPKLWQFQKKHASAPVESYFLAFSKNVLQHKPFQSFWNKRFESAKRKAVTETFDKQLSKLLLHSGFSIKVFINVNQLNLRYKNPMLKRPALMLKEQNPFLKIDSFFNSREPLNLLKLVGKHTDYPIPLIKDHINETFNPNDSAKIFKKNLLFNQPGQQFKETRSKLKVAIHIHVFYPDIFETIFQLLAGSQIKADLFITTDSADKKREVETIVSKHNSNIHLIGIDICENSGRDIMPWLSLSDKLQKYDVAGHFHTKKSAYKEQQWIGESWMGHMIETLITPVLEIIEVFEKDENIGIIIPDIAYPLQGKIYNNHKKNEYHIKDLWERLQTKKALDVSEDIQYMIFSYGNMFWYRPQALQPLFDLKFSINELPPEPIPPDGTLAHALERLPVYIAWSQDYDFRIVLHPDLVSSSFQSAEKFQIPLMNKKAWKAGKILIWFPSKAKKAIIKLVNK